MRDLLARHRPDLVIHVLEPVDALVDPAAGPWPVAEDDHGLGLLAAELGCRHYTQVSRTDLFDAVGSGQRHDPEASDASLRAALENERANAEHLRRLSRQQRDLLRRRAVRLALAVDSVANRMTATVGLRRRRVNRRVAKATLIASALVERRELGRRRSDLAAVVGGLPEPPVLDRRVSIIVVTSEPLAAAPPLPADLDAELVVVLNGRRAAPPPDCTPVVVRSEYKTVTAAAASGAAKAKGRLLCFLAPTSEPLDPHWVVRLGAAIEGDTIAATPMLLHPERPLPEATPHDLRVRELGLDVVADEDDGPVVEAREAGAEARRPRVTIEVPAASGACLMVERAAFDDAGGLALLDDFDTAVIDLCGRLRAGGGKVVAVPAAMVTDHRPVRSIRALSRPIDPDTRAWRALVDRQGPTLLQLARGDRVTEHLRIALTVAAPSSRAAEQWGDWHLGNALARSLRRVGHSVHVQTANQANDPAGRSCDVHLVLRGLSPVQRTEGQRHVMWIISHPESVDIQECDDADLVLVASERYAADLRQRTRTPVEVLLQGTDTKRFGPRPPDPLHAHAVAVVAMTRHVFRPSVAYALAAGLRPAIYGTGWDEFVDPDLIVTDFIPNNELATVYSSVGVLLNDHWDTMRAWGFVSNRVFDALACGTPIVTDHLPELVTMFGDSLATYRDADELRQAVEIALDDPVAARRRAEEGRRAVVDHHTFEHRADQLLAALERHGLTRPPR
jgi:hypothetical protein